MMKFSDNKAKLDDLLARMAEAIQLDKTRKEKMKSAYEAIEHLLNEDESFFKSIDFEIYPQGSVKIGTTVKPIAKNEFDLDIVVHIRVDWSQYTPENIYDELKRVLENSERHKDMVESKNRCIRLNYAGDFHMDILPGCQENEFDQNKLKVPDKELGDWTSGNPRGYADWFKAKYDSVTQTLLEKAYAAEDLPPDEFTRKKPLQRAVQLIKMYRDKFFEDKPKVATSSIILTTIAGQYYNGEDSIYETIDGMLSRIKDVLRRGRGMVVVNPVNSDEDFTDKWHKEPILYEHFKKFIAHLDDEWKKLKADNEVEEEAIILKGLFGKSIYNKGYALQHDYLEKAHGSKKTPILD